MGGSKAQTQTQQTQTTTTQQTDQRVGASEQGIVAQHGATAVRDGILGGDVTIQTLDADVIAGALGLSDTVSRELVDLAGRVGEEALRGMVETAGYAIDETGRISQAGLDLARDVSLGAGMLAESLVEQGHDLSRDAIREMADVSREISADALGFGRDAMAESYFFAGDVSRGAGELAGQSLDAVSRAMDNVSQLGADAHALSERTTAEMSLAFDRFGTDLAAVTERVTLAHQTDGDSERNKTVIIVVLIGAALAAVTIFRRKT